MKVLENGEAREVVCFAKDDRPPAWEKRPRRARGPRRIEVRLARPDERWRVVVDTP